MLISDTSVKHKTTVFVLTFLIIIAGLLSYYDMPRESAPEVVIPNVFVQTNYRGVSPEDIENSITKEIEDKLRGLKNVKKIKSTSKEGSSHINIEFVTGTDIDDAVQKVKDKVDQAKAELPSDLDDDPSVYEVNFSEMPILIMALSGNCGLKMLRDIAEDLEEDIEGVPGVLEVDITGGLIREIHIEIDPNRMALYGVPFTALSSVVSGENANISGGSIKTGEGKYQLRLEGEFKTAEEAEQIIVMTRGTGPVYLKDIASIKDSFKDMNTASRLDGKDSVNIYVKKRAGENIIEIVKDVKALMAERKADWPEGVEIANLMDQSDQIHDMVADLENNIISGLILVIIVVCIAMGFRNAILVSLSIPLSMMMGFIILKALGITLNMVVLFSLTLALGMLVDNAIVIIENIYRFMQEGVSRTEAAMKATSEVAYPIIGSGLTTIAAFLPMVFWGGVMGGFMKYIPITVIIVLASCLFVALVINPAIASVFMKIKKQPENPKTAEEVMSAGESPLDKKDDSRIIAIYKKVLRAALGVDIPHASQIKAADRKERYLRHLFTLAPRLSVLVFAGLSFIMMISFWYAVTGVKTPVEFFPEVDPERINVTIDFPEGVDLAYCNKVSKEIEKSVFDKRYNSDKSIPYADTARQKTHKNNEGTEYQGPSDIENIDNSYTRVSSLGGDSEVSFTFLDIQKRTERSPKTQKKIEERLGDITGAKITVDKPNEGPPTGAPINIEIVGEDMKILGLIAERVKTLVRRVPFTKNIKDNYKQGAPTLSIKVDRKRAALVGLSSSAIGYALKSAVNGAEISTYREGDDDFDIIMRFEDIDRHKIETLDKLFIPTRNYGPIPLTTVVDIEYIGGLGQIERIDHDRVVTVSADIDIDNTTGDTARKEAEKLLEGSPFYSTNSLFAGVKIPDDKAQREKQESENLLKLSKFKLPEFLKEDHKEYLKEFLECESYRELSSKLNFYINHNKFKADFDIEKLLTEIKTTHDIKDKKQIATIKNLILIASTNHKHMMQFNRMMLDKIFHPILKPREQGLELPPGYTYRFTGEEEHQKESEEFLNWAGSVAIALIFMILVSQFNSVLYPFIIISSVVLSIGGIFLGLGICNLPFGIIMTGVGVISLAGVVVNNAIVLIDYIIQLRERGMKRDEAIIAAGVTRLRPVLLTAITTILGLIPMATGVSFDFHIDTFGFQTGSESSQWWVSMAVAVIFGLGVATMLTLIVVPVLFSLLDDLHNMAFRLFAKGCKEFDRAKKRYWLWFWGMTGMAPTPEEPCYEEYIKRKMNE
ncbi:MAG: efflux RND transporter permease subunit [Planctomycetota bacterium]|jgi:multidrug efflux pump subunit AcrB